MFSQKETVTDIPKFYAGRSCLIGEELYEVTFILNNIKFSDYSPAVTAEGNTPLSVIAVSTRLFVGCAVLFSLRG